MHVLGVGLSRTGTTSLAKALTLLGYKTLHWSPKRLRDVIMGKIDNPDWQRYDDVDAVTDLPAALFYNELLQAYPGTKCILTIRDTERWLKSITQHYEETIPNKFSGTLLREAKATQMFAYGSCKVVPYLYRKRYEDHNQLVQHEIPPEQLLILDIERGSNGSLMQELCDFLECPNPGIPFPHVNQSRR